MEIKEILTEKPWETFLLDIPHTPFLQSWGWGEFQETLGLSHYRFGVYKGGDLVGVCQALEGERRLGRFIYVPHGPVLAEFSPGTARMVLNYLKDFARKRGVDYLRIDPPWEAGEGNRRLLEEAGFRSSPAATSQAGGRTLLLDLETGEDDLLAGMRKTTRYEVRKAAEAGVKVERTTDIHRLAEFHRLMGATRHRQGFTPHPRSYLQTEFEVLAKRRMIELSLASYEGDVVSAALTVFYGDTASYVHGASVRSAVPASHLLLWENIKEAKKDGSRHFDFWGIAPEGANERHPWWGYTLFKRGFGGYPVDYLGTWDYVLNPKYFAVSAAENVRRLIRRF